MQRSLFLLNNTELVLYMNNMPKRENVILLFYIMSGVMVGIVCRKCMSVISGQLALIALFHQHGTGSVPVRAPNFEPFGAFRPKINWFGTRKVGSQLEPKNSRFSLRTVMTSVGVSFSRFKVHCATPSVDDASFITMVPLKTGGNAGWFAR